MPRTFYTPDITSVRESIETEFPMLWPAFDAGLATCATLLLHDNANPVCLIYVAGASSGKTTIAECFIDHALTYRSDSFTPASFVSHAANVSRDQLASVDLLPRIKYKVLVTPELAPLFRGREDDLTRNFTILTRVLDGRGLLTDSGTHGQRGYQGDYLFAWLGCTTPIDSKVWRIMSTLGSRLFFYCLDDDHELTVNDLLQNDHGLPYRERVERCRKIVHAFLTELFTRYGGVRGVQWNSGSDPSVVLEWIIHLAILLAKMRGEPVPDGNNVREYVPERRESPLRIKAVLYNLARGHALVHGRSYLTMEDVPLVAKVAVSTMPSECRILFQEVIVNQGRPLTTDQAAKALKVQHHDTARRYMEEVGRRGVMEFRAHGVGKSSELGLTPEWEWCAQPGWREYFLSE